MDFIDYYEAMGLEPDATPEQIKRAYRTLARRYHPDVSKEADAEVKFKEIGEAYYVLKDPERRSEYDLIRQHQSTGGGFNVPPGWQRSDSNNPDSYSAEDLAGFSEFFEQAFGNRARPPYSADVNSAPDIRGQDVQSELLISLHDAFRGTIVSATLQVPVWDEDGSIRELRKYKAGVASISGTVKRVPCVQYGSVVHRILI